MTVPLVSVVIPAYNCARTLRATVQSALAQTMPDLEVIIVDDGSLDDTALVAEGIADARVRLVSQTNEGAASARNAGIKQARGKWIALLDADDLWLSHKLERQLAVLQANSDAQAIQTGVYFVDDDLRVSEIRECVQPKNTLLTFLRFQNLPAFSSTWLIAREMFDRTGLFDTELVILEDWDMAIKIARLNDPICMAEPLALYRIHPENRSRDLDIHVEPGFRVLERLFADPTLPQEIRDHECEIYGRFYLMLCGGAFKVKRWRDCIRWGRRAVRTDPGTASYIAMLPMRRLRRALSGRGEVAIVRDELQGVELTVGNH